MLDVVRSDDVDKVKTLLKASSSLTERDAATGRTPLHEAVAAANVEMVRVLLAAGADPNAGDNRGVSAFDLGMASGNGSIAKLLIEARFTFASPRDTKWPMTLYDFALRSDIGVVRMMLDMKADPNSRAPDGSTALHGASLKGNGQMVELLLARGANVNSRTNAGSTPLHDAALGGNRAPVEMLLAHGAEVEARDSESKVTPLYYAVQMERSEVAEALLRKRGADRCAERSGG